MAGEGLNTQSLYRSDTRQLGLYMVQTDAQGERSFAYWRDNSAARQTLNLMPEPPTRPDHFFFSGISLAILDNAQRAKLFDLVQA